VFGIVILFVDKISVILLYDNFLGFIRDICYVTKEKLQKQIGKRIIYLREKRGWSQSDLARESGKDRQAIEKLENGKVNPTAFSLYEISKALEVSLAELLAI
jgi:putative transcriptional regulator